MPNNTADSFYEAIFFSSILFASLLCGVIERRRIKRRIKRKRRVVV